MSTILQLIIIKEFVIVGMVAIQISVFVFCFYICSQRLLMCLWQVMCEADIYSCLWQVTCEADAYSCVCYRWCVRLTPTRVFITGDVWGRRLLVYLWHMTCDADAYSCVCDRWRVRPTSTRVFVTCDMWSRRLLMYLWQVTCEADAYLQLNALVCHLHNLVSLHTRYSCRLSLAQYVQVWPGMLLASVKYYLYLLR